MYKKYFHNGDRRGIFKVVTEEFKIKKAIYPGSYIHLAPSFYIPEVVYVDSFKKTNKFFTDKNIQDFINNNKNYEEDTIVRFHLVDFYKDIEEKLDSFDLLISQYAGFVSQCCKKYLKPGGLLVANNSHGDASMASIDKSLDFIGVVYYSNKIYRFTTKNLDKYFIPKKNNITITKEYLEKTMKGIGYTKTASAYLFKKI
jgi:hypothetical protein